MNRPSVVRIGTVDQHGDRYILNDWIFYVGDILDPDTGRRIFDHNEITFNNWTIETFDAVSIHGFGVAQWSLAELIELSLQHRINQMAEIAGQLDD